LGRLQICFSGVTYSQQALQLMNAINQRVAKLIKLILIRKKPNLVHNFLSEN
jgi:hypothetical protein